MKLKQILIDKQELIFGLVEDVSILYNKDTYYTEGVGIDFSIIIGHKHFSQVISLLKKFPFGVIFTFECKDKEKEVNAENFFLDYYIRPVFSKEMNEKNYPYLTTIDFNCKIHHEKWENFIL